MERFALVLALAAVALAGWVALREPPSSGSSSAAEPSAATAETVAALEARIAALEKAPKPVMADPASGPGQLAAGSAGGASPAAGSAGAKDPLAALEERIASVEKRTASLPADGEGALTAARQGLQNALAGRVWSPSFYRSLDDAAKDLDLSGGQRADFERAIADAKRDLDDLRRTPDDEGKTWADAQREMLQPDASGALKLDFGKLAAFGNKNVPGRNETFTAAEQRIRDEAKRRMRDALVPEQREKFDRAHVDPLIGAGMGGPRIAFAPSVIMTAPAEPAMSGGR